VPPVRTQRGRLVRVARTYPTEARGDNQRTCQLSEARLRLRLRMSRRASRQRPLAERRGAAEPASHGGSSE
jgi:hypothetical protein